MLILDWEPETERKMHLINILRLLSGAFQSGFV